MKTYGTLYAFQEAVENFLFDKAELFLMRSDEFAVLMRERAEGNIYDFPEDFRQLRFDVVRDGDNVTLTLRRAFGPRGFRQHYEGTPRGHFSWESFEVALEGSALDAGEMVSLANSREFVRLASFVAAVAEDERYVRRVERTWLDAPARDESPAFQREEVQELRATRH